DGEKSLWDAMLELKYVGSPDTTPGKTGDIGIASTSGEPKEYPLLAGPSMNITLVMTDAPDSLGADGDKNGTVTRLGKREGNLQCVRVCVSALLSLSCLCFTWSSC